MTALQAVLCFWFGGTVAFACIATAWVRAVPDQVEELEVTTLQLIYATIFWPWALWHGYGAIKEQQRERAKRKCVDCGERLTPLTRRSHVCRTLVTPVDPPTPCPECLARMNEFQDRVSETMKLSPQPCEACAEQFRAWQKSVGFTLGD